MAMTDQWHGRDVQGPGAAVTRPLPATMLPVEIEIYEPDAEPTRSRARARLRTHDKTLLEGRGEASCHSRHGTVQVSREMAAARALTDLAHQLFELAATEDAAACGRGL
ncbi:hypothetical protein W59_21133 [Rhodococcus opacus RKJ300 = JCM 13270]|uniref:DUF1876 domain-containing protein n=3 Tax=Rhodococcus TaxID=1827 RepID=I0WND0_RHOOP|nr:hypothetical protein W59_21133 [Rhodococcus opacus RKJ300 = JCM 13270]